MQRLIFDFKLPYYFKPNAFMTFNHDTAQWMSGVVNPIAQSALDVYSLEF